jgi:hypothetical protein
VSEGSAAFLSLAHTNNERAPLPPFSRVAAARVHLMRGEESTVLCLEING